MDEQVIIAGRFCGPPDSGNGGYVCGLVARYVDGTAEVTLRLPPPLDRPLSVLRTNGGVELRDGDAVVAEGRATTLDLAVPDAVSYAEAEAAVPGYTGFQQHVFPTCFVCGPRREPDDALCIFAAPVAGRDVVAAPWTPHPSLADATGHVAHEFIWAALDCPGAFALGFEDGLPPMLLGRLAARVHRTVHAGERCVVIGWPLGGEGRKRLSGTALFNAQGDVCGVARATWILPRTGA